VIVSSLSLKSICSLQLLHQIDVVLLCRLRGDFVFGDFLPCIVLVFPLRVDRRVSRNVCQMICKLRRWYRGARGVTDLEVKSARLGCLGEFFARSLFEVCVELMSVDQSR